MKDRKPKYPGRVELTPVPGQTNIYDMRRADQPEEEGDALNKANLLPDETAERLGLDPGKNPQVKDAFEQMISNFEDRYKVGDIRDTIRPSLGDKWALCNGDNVFRDSGDTNPELYDLLGRGIKTVNLQFKLDNALQTYSAIYTQMINGMWCIAYFGDNGTAAVLDPYTGFFKVVGNKKAMMDGYPYGYIIGIVWNGSEYVMCSVASEPPYGALWFYKSTDLETWTKVKTFEPTDAAGWDQSYGPMKFIWDGAAYRVNCQYSGYQATRLYTMDANFNRIGTMTTTNYGISATNGYFIISSSSYLDLYKPGSTERFAQIFFSSGDSNNATTLAEYAENKFVAVPYGTFHGTLRFYDITDAGAKSNGSLDITKFGRVIPEGSNTSIYPAYLRTVLYDSKTDELCFGLSDSEAKICTARIAASADKSVKENYRFTWESIDFTTNFMAYEKNWVYAKTNTVTGANSHPRNLPAISRDECYTFIKIEEGE